MKRQLSTENMIPLVIYFFLGSIFALGLMVSGMTQPSKVTGFLDLFGAWDPSLAFVMIGAILSYLPIYRLGCKRMPRCQERAPLLPKRSIDAPLLIGATLFGIGWGLSGFCPAPAVVALGSGQLDVFLFCVAMIGGFLVHNALRSYREKTRG